MCVCKVREERRDEMYVLCSLRSLRRKRRRMSWLAWKHGDKKNTAGLYYYFLEYVIKQEQIEKEQSRTVLYCTLRVQNEKQKF